MNDLPEFRNVSIKTAWSFVQSVFGANALQINESDDNHFRVIFKSTQFHIPEDRDEPSKSQWSSLKKRMKRHNHDVFVFKQTGKADCSESSNDETIDCYYVDFGFFAD